MTEFTLPNLGENVEKGDVLRVLVKVGDTLKKEQPVLELETDKATIEVPSTVDGVVKEIRVKAGDKVTPGQAVLTVDAGGAAAEAPAKPKKAEAEAKPAKAEEKAEKPAKAEKQAEPAPRQAEPAPRQGSAQAEPAEPEEPEEQEAQEEPASRRASVVDFKAGRHAPGAGEPVGPAAPAAPSVRRLAREIGVDIHQVQGSGPGGRISPDDVKDHARNIMSRLGPGGQAALATAAPGAGAAPMTAVPLPDFAKWGEIERKAMSGIRRKTAEHLSRAWNTIPHVTQFDKADITALEELRKRYGAEAEKAGGKLTVTAIAAKVLASALKVFPQFNASVDAANEAIVYKKYVHVGIAVDTEHGLLVPVIRDADRKNIVEIAVEIQQLAEKARARKLSLDEMSGGSMSVTNLGGLGGTAFTPIVNWPEVAILGLSRGAMEPVWRKETKQFEPRLMLPLSLSYDHRLIDGADAIRFLRWVVEALEQPFTLALRG